MKTAVERSMDHQAKLAAQGYRRMSVWLSPEDAESLALLARTYGVSKAEALREAVRDSTAELTA